MLDSTYPNKLYNECRILWESQSFGCGTTPCQVTGGWTAIILVLLVQCLLMVQAPSTNRPIAFQACYSIRSIRSEIQKKSWFPQKQAKPTTQPIPTNQRHVLENPPTLYHANWRNAVRLRIKCSCLRSEIGYQGKVPPATQTVHLLPLCLPDLIL